ncbi:Gfo/Idh/MocA family protein [Dyadobacter sandarakinus]|uniref:Gfo/Idh/MocA family oxidoreductase n=1 Tax=Dyadobacter sandarakinus TaxID=2747268 RepID=A0ABX7I2S3_9BACT|nr:Gfo/Idh/MocA family oxidoreductase [Dyadobacter sandarakinus]QRR00188.1 Gfo/Idh/MocA family oxidoreductase [Dyadobacter sandarakinus]
MKRRAFIRNTAGATASAIAFPTLIPASALGKNGFVSPSDRINLAFIGAGNQAENDVNGFLPDKRVQVTTICDVNKKSTGYWDGKMGGREYLTELVDNFYTKENGKTYKATKGSVDFREVIDRKDIDAVAVLTPDHWHSIPVLMAAKAGKHMYCQKPLSLTISEGRAMSNAVKKSGVVFQTGSQQRSAPEFLRVCELVRNGRIGKLEKVVCGLPGGTPDFGKTGQLTAPTPVPKDFDYQTWLGPAPEAPYCPARTHVNFRWNLDYSGGMVTDWGAHHLDIAQWGIGTDHTGPVEIRNPKAKWSNDPVWNTAVEFYFEGIYENGVKLIVGSDASVAPRGITFHGSEGQIWVSRGSYKVTPEKIDTTVIGDQETRLYKSENHYRNFIDCVISKKLTAAPAEIGHRSVTVAHLGNIALLLNQNLKWNPEKEEFVENFAANQLRARVMREPWGELYRKYKV